MKHEYQLHAVMVHEGSIDSGHYWAYVLDHQRKVWLKFNDNTVNEASWDELSKESMGGHSNTSAYSLVYIGNIQLRHSGTESQTKKLLKLHSKSESEIDLFNFTSFFMA